jgi:hypothetical protein
MSHLKSMFLCMYICVFHVCSFLYTILAIGPYCFINKPMSKPIQNRIKQWYKAYLSRQLKKKLSIKGVKSVYETKNIFIWQDSSFQWHAAAPMCTLIPTFEATYFPHPEGRWRYPSTTAATSHHRTGSSNKLLRNTQKSRPWLSFHFFIFLPTLRL